MFYSIVVSFRFCGNGNTAVPYCIQRYVLRIIPAYKIVYAILNDVFGRCVPADILRPTEQNIASLKFFFVKRVDVITQVIRYRPLQKPVGERMILIRNKRDCNIAGIR